MIVDIWDWVVHFSAFKYKYFKLLSVSWNLTDCCTWHVCEIMFDCTALSVCPAEIVCSASIQGRYNFKTVINAPSCSIWVQISDHIKLFKYQMIHVVGLAVDTSFCTTITKLIHRNFVQDKCHNYKKLFVISKVSN